MPALRADDKEQVRMLVISVGCSEASRQTGIPLNTILSWSARGEWLKPRAVQPLPPSMQGNAIAAIKPADALQNVMQDLTKDTKLAGMRFAKRTVQYAAEIAETEPAKALVLATDVKSALQSAAIAGDWSAGKDDHSLHLSFFQLSADREEAAVEQRTIDVEQA